MRYAVTTDSTSEPVTLTEVKAHLRIDHALDDTWLTTNITTARMYVENYIRMALFTQTITAKWDKFPAYFLLERPPLQTVTSIYYLDTTGASQLLSSANYVVDTSSTPASITLAYGYTWPSTRDQVAAITIVYVAGYATVGAIPLPIKHAILMLMGHWYENRETIGDTVGQLAELPFAVQSLLTPYRAYQ
jgi:uncharacterized phiE125 gp8 family phage protein